MAKTKTNGWNYNRHSYLFVNNVDLSNYINDIKSIFRTRGGDILLVIIIAIFSFRILLIFIRYHCTIYLFIFELVNICFDKN